jgi:hypothetical protein
MNTFQLYGTWKRLLGQWLTDTCRTRRINLCWLIVGLYLGGKVQAGHIVTHWGVKAKAASLTRRLSRFLDNGAVRPQVWFRPVARRILARWVGATVTLILDATRVSAGKQMVMLAVAYRKRALPLTWDWLPYVRGHAPAQVQLALVQRVRNLLPEGVQVILTGDSGFGSVALMQHVSDWGWQYVLRQTGKHLMLALELAPWVRLDSLVTGPDQQVWCPDVTFTQRRKFRTHVLAHWARGEDEPWLLTTNLPSPRAACQAYARRMWIEEMFGDWKGHGWNLQATHLRHPDRLSRLLLALCLLYVWLLLYGERIIRAGRRAWVDRHDRRDLSLVRIAHAVLQRCLTLLIQPPVPFPSLVGAASVR